MYCVLEGQLQFYIDKVMVSFHFGIPYSTFEGSCFKMSLKHYVFYMFREVDAFQEKQQNSS